MKDCTERLELCRALSAAVVLIAAWPHILLIRAVLALHAAVVLLAAWPHILLIRAVCSSECS